MRIYGLLCQFFSEILLFRFPQSIQYEQKKNSEIIHLSYDEVSDKFRAVDERAEYIRNPSSGSLKMFTYNLRLGKFHSQGNVASLC